MKLSKKILLVLCTFFIGLNFVLADDLDCSKTLKRGSKGNNRPVRKLKFFIFS